MGQCLTFVRQQKKEAFFIGHDEDAGQEWLILRIMDSGSIPALDGGCLSDGRVRHYYPDIRQGRWG